MKTTGYSGTPLARKLGIKDGDSIQIFNSPKNYIDFFFDFPNNVKIVDQIKSTSEIDFIQIFSTNKDELKAFFSIAKPNLKKSGILWLSWPKKSSKIKTDLDKSIILGFGLDNGLVDTKVAAIDKDWSGHKFVYRKKDR